MAIGKVSGVAWANIAKFGGVSKASIANLGGGATPPSSGPSFVTDDLIGWWDPTQWNPSTQTRVPDLAYTNGYKNVGHSLGPVNGATKTTVDNTDAFYTDGVNDYFSVGYAREPSLGAHSGDIFNVNSLTNYTTEIWFRSNGSFINNGNLWGAGYNSGTRMRFSSSGVSWIYPRTSIYPGWTASTDTWYHMVVTMETNGNGSYEVLKLYVDGSLYYTKNNLSWAPNYNRAVFLLGTYGSRSERGRFYYGVVRRYNVPLTATEVAQNYAAEKSRYGHT